MVIVWVLGGTDGAGGSVGAVIADGKGCGWEVFAAIIEGDGFSGEA